MQSVWGPEIDLVTNRLHLGAIGGCGIRECPIRIDDAGDLTLEIE
jgi:hypothetical protein